MIAAETSRALQQLVADTGATAVYFNHLYDPISLVRDHEVGLGSCCCLQGFRAWLGPMVEGAWLRMSRGREGQCLQRVHPRIPREHQARPRGTACHSFDAHISAPDLLHFICFCSQVKQVLSKAGIECRSFNADLLYEPWEVLDEGGQPLTSFDSFWSRRVVNARICQRFVCFDISLR